MIVAETPAAYRFITQPDHAALAGTFAEAWGGEPFEHPSPSPAVEIAAYTHDDGWWRTDRRPHRSDDGTPVDFHELPADRWTALYDEGIESAVEVDQYAGLLVAMHGAGLRRRRYGLSPDWTDTPPAFAEFVSRQEDTQRELATALTEQGSGEGASEDADGRVSTTDLDLLNTLHETGEPPDGMAPSASDADTRLWFNYRLLQALDTLSLRICATNAAAPETAERLSVSNVPTTAGDPDATLSLEPVGPHHYRVDPYPFDVSPVLTHIPARTVRKEAFDDERELVRAYYEADREELQITLRE